MECKGYVSVLTVLLCELWGHDTLACVLRAICRRRSTPWYSAQQAWLQSLQELQSRQGRTKHCLGGSSASVLSGGSWGDDEAVAQQLQKEVCFACHVCLAAAAAPSAPAVTESAPCSAAARSGVAALEVLEAGSCSWKVKGSVCMSRC